MDHWVLHIFMFVGLVTIVAYAYMAFIRCSSSFPRPSRVVIVGLAFIAIVGALIPISQFNGEELTFGHYARILYVALGLPGLAVSLSMFRVLISDGPGYFTKR